MLENKDSFENQYATSLRKIILNGIDTDDRTGVGRKRILSQHFRFDISDYTLPLLYGKKVYPKMAIKEMVWMLMGKTNISFLEKHKVTYWREWADENGDLGKVYGYQFRNFNGVDQLESTVKNLIEKPNSSQTLISLWNPADLNEMALPPCHFLYHFLISPDKDGVKRLNCFMMQRSADSFLGVPYNALMVSFITILLAKYVGVEPGEINWTLNDYHLYLNHIEQAEQYLANVRENKFGTIGKSTPLNFGLKSYDPKVHETYVSGLDNFFKECDEAMFKNIIVNPLESYDPITADIAV